MSVIAYIELRCIPRHNYSNYKTSTLHLLAELVLQLLSWEFSESSYLYHVTSVPPDSVAIEMHNYQSN